MEPRLKLVANESNWLSLA